MPLYYISKINPTFLLDKYTTLWYSEATEVYELMTIKELRMKTGLSQSQFAKKYKFTVKQVQSWEQGWRNTPEYVLYLLERVIDLDYANTVLQMNEIQTDEKSEGIK